MKYWSVDPMLSWRPRVVTLLARHGAAKYADALPEICDLFQRRLPAAAHDVLVIDNALALDHEERLAPGITLIGGSNVAWEFSAWDAGLAYLRNRLDEYDLVNLATSAFRQLYVDYLERFDLDMLNLLRGRAAAIGHIDYSNTAASLLQTGSQAWLRSSFIMLPPNELRLLKTLLSVTDPSLFFSGDPECPFREDAPVSADFRHDVLSWLTGEGTGQGVSWHSRFVLDASTLSYFESKTLAIFNERMLSNRLRAQGCAIVDATWLATRSRVKDGASITAIPNWRLQVTSRDAAAAPTSLLKFNE